MTRSLNVVLCAHVDLVKKLARAIQLDNEHLIICSVNLDTQLTILPPYHLISAMPQVCIRKTDSPPYSSLCPALASVCSREASRSHSSTRLGQARSWDKPFNVLGPSPLLGQALQRAWDKPALGTGPSTCLGQARSWDKPAMACMRMYVCMACMLKGTMLLLAQTLRQ